MTWVLVLLAVPAAFVLLDRLLPRAGRPPRWRALRDRLWHRPPPPPDPFETYRVQARLGVLAAEIRWLEGDEAQVYAKAHRLRASRCAYADLLGDACRLAGVPPLGDPDEREVALAARGWTW